MSGTFILHNHNVEKFLTNLKKTNYDFDKESESFFFYLKSMY